MRPNIHTIGSFSETLLYCTQDKKLKPGDEDRQQTVYKDRAEILYYNQCFGGKTELARQFKEVAALNLNTVDPGFHISLSLAPGEQVDKSKLVEISLDCAQKMGFSDNQFVTILHKDTANQHIHIVANRVRFDGTLVNDSFALKKLYSFCKEAEERHDLTRTLTSRQEQTQGQRLPFNDQRVEKLNETIGQTLKTACNWQEYEASITSQGIKVYKNEKGTAYLVDHRVVLRGSQAGFPWKKIEAALKENERQQLLQQQEKEEQQQQTQRVRHRISHHF
jgi:hypothetical protein